MNSTGYPWTHDQPIDSPLAKNLFGLINVLGQVEAVRLTALASTALLLYDHIITFDVEVERVWSLRWRLPKISFLVNRYITPPLLVFNTIVLTLPNLSVELPILAHVAGMADSLSYCNGRTDLDHASICYLKRIMYFLLALFCCEVGAMLGMIGFLYRSNDNPYKAPSYLPGCYSLGFVPWLWGFWVGPVVLESVIIILTLMKAFRLMTDPVHGSPTLRLIARDSVIYFFIMFSVLFSNLFIFKYAPPFVSSLLIGPSSCIACVAVARMMMNMRSLSLNVYATELDTLGSIAFRGRSTNGRSQMDSMNTIGY